MDWVRSSVWRCRVVETRARDETVDGCEKRMLRCAMGS